MAQNTVKHFSLERKKQRTAYTFLFIPMLFYVGIRFYPTFFAFYLSLTDWNIVSKEMHLVGLENYTRLFGDKLFYQTLKNTFTYVIWGLPISLLLGFTLAYHIDRVKRGESIYKAMYFVPYVTSMVAVAWVWRWLYQPVPIGVFNNLLSAIGLPTQPFLMSKTQALPSILTTTIWADLGFQMIIFLAGIKAISPSLIEAARIDGATEPQLLFSVTIPLLRPTLIFLLITGTIRYLRIFTQVMNMTFQGEGGPLNSTKPLVLYIYTNAFKSFKMGYAAAMTVVLFVIILIITLIQMVVTRDEN